MNAFFLCLRSSSVDLPPPRPRRVAVLVFRALLWIGIVVTLALLVGAWWDMTHSSGPAQDDGMVSNDLPDFSGLVWLVVIAFGLAVAIPASLFLVALRRPRPRLAITSLLVSTVAFVVWAVAIWFDLRENPAWLCAV